MSLVALVGYVVFVLLAFGLRGWIHYRRTGSSGFVGISGVPGSAEWFGGVLFVVAMIAAFLAPLADLAGIVTSNESIATGGLQTSGIVLLGAGLVGTLWAQFAMGESWRIGVNESERTSLVSSGPFRWVRNPIFSAMILATLGLLLLVPNGVSVAALVALVVAVQIQVRYVEEPYLTRSHGERYLGYARRTGRFVPGIGRLHVDSTE